ncbi:hypothetical protein [Amycolatopsis anabasis]|uniref:hypothetical protein n=1 Tax=Amycolatopsis anabasis TaxID=1840409 RepID=UPI00131B9F8C|nr:hypothetical protein [Amycolatopsis anabasis]
MPPSRRKPVTPPPARKPKVAGLRKPTAGTRPSPSPRPRAEAAEPETTDTPAEPEATAAPEAPPEPEPAAAEPGEATRVDALTGEPEAEDEAPAEKPAPKPKPSPRSKTRDSGTRKPESEAEAAGEPEPAPRDPEQAAAAAKRRKKFLLAGALVLVGLLLTGFAVFAKIKQNELDSATSNTALLDMAKTAQVKQEVNSAVEALFSYNYNDIAKTENAAKDLLVTDTVRDKYNKEFAEVKRLAPEQKMVVTCKVTRSAVILLDGDRAKVLVFVDQTSIRTDKNEKSAGGSQLSVTTELRDGKWKVTDMDAYNSSQPAASGQQPAPSLPGGNQPPPSK